MESVTLIEGGLESVKRKRDMFNDLSYFVKSWANVTIISTNYLSFHLRSRVAVLDHSHKTNPVISN